MHHEETQDEKAQVSWGACQRNDFSEPRLLHLPIHRKALNSLTWDIGFSLINNNLVVKAWIYPGSPLTSSEQSLRVIWDAVSQTSVLSFVCQIKYNSQLLGCDFFPRSWQFVWFFNWSRVAWQCCVSFCCTAKWMLCIYIYSLFFSFPSHLGHHRALNRVVCAPQ